MRLNEIDLSGGLPVDGYGPGFFRVGGERFDGAIAVLPGGVETWGGFADTSTLIAAKDKLDVLFIGTGAEMAYLPEDFRTALEAEGLAAEPMASPAACRTYNILLSEGRRVGLALIPV